VEKADLFVVDLAALLHDIDDWKFNNGDFDASSRNARQIMSECGIELCVINQVCDIIDHVSYRGALVDTSMPAIEGQVVQDADRLDSLGAIGIARTFAYGGHTNRPLYDAKIPPKLHQTAEEYKEGGKTSINHFYEKLLLVKDRLNTRAAQRLAAERHRFTQSFVDRFLKEWTGEV